MLCEETQEYNYSFNLFYDNQDTNIPIEMWKFQMNNQLIQNWNWNAFDSLFNYYISINYTSTRVAPGSNKWVNFWFLSGIILRLVKLNTWFSWIHLV